MSERLPAKTCVTLLALGCLGLCAPGADEEVEIKTPQPAQIQFNTGRVLRGTLVSATNKEVRFRLARAGTVAARYKVEQVRAIATADGVYVFSKEKKRWVNMKSRTAKAPPDKAKKESSPPAKAPPVEGAVAPGMASVVVEGSGADREEALKDAFRAAVRKVAGALVVGSITVKDDRVISDKVLTYSDGIVHTYKELGHSTDRGLHKVKITALVVSRKVADRLVKAGFKVKDVDGAGMAAEVMTRVEARKRATELLQDALVHLPKVLVAEARRPAARDYDEDSGELTVDIVVRADPARYQKVLGHLLLVLERVHLGKDAVVITSKVIDDSGADGAPKALASETVRGFMNGGLREGQKGWYLWVMTGSAASYSPTGVAGTKDLRRGRGMTGSAALSNWTRWQVYHLDSDLSRSLAAITGKVSVRVSFLDKEGEEITQHEIDLGMHANPTYKTYKARYGWLTFLRKSSPASTRENPLVAVPNVAIAPVALVNTYNSLAHKPVKAYRRKVSLSAKDLKRLKDIKCEIVYQEGEEAGRRVLRGRRKGARK